ncbi:MAG: hypothetical protein HYU67_04515 [Flavobacteriia bacterium]|nr:hypothetical protein [Flavobacteriia bacterium]
MNYQKLFIFLHEQHELILLNEEMQEIVKIVKEMIEEDESKEMQKITARKSCNHSCSPSDFYKSGKCDIKGCYP